jgi:O-antigen/teichoic acid export membrane protein
MKSIFQVFSFDIISRILIGVLGILLIRLMGENEYALYTFTFSVISVVSQTIASTFKRIYIVGYKRFQIDNHVESFLGLQIVIIFIFTFMTLPFKNYFNGMYLWTIIMILGFVLVEYSKTTYQNKQEFMKYSIVELSRSLLFSILTVILIFLYREKISAWQVFMVQSSTMVLVFIFANKGKIRLENIFKLKKAIKIGKKIFVGPYKYLIYYTFLITILGQLDIFMLKILSSNNELSTYGSAFRYYSLLLLALSSINAVFLPAIQNIKKRSELENLYNKHNKTLFFLIPLILLGAWLAKWIIPVIDLGKYPSSVLVFQILSLSAILSFIFSPHANLMMKLEKFKILFLIILSSVLMNLILNFLMIPTLQSVGAAIATLVTFGFNNLMTFFYAKKYLRYV